MTTQRQWSRTHSGFTLLEILVGVVIMAVIIGMVTLALGRDRGPQRLNVATQRARAMIDNHCRQQSILQGRTIGWRLTETNGDWRYLFVSRASDTWLPTGPAPETLPAGITAWVELEGRRTDRNRNDDEEELQPQVLCFASGEMTPFTLHLELESPLLHTRLSGRGNGMLDVIEAK